MRYSLLAISALAAGTLGAQTPDMHDMHGMHHDMPATVSPLARKQIDSVAKAVQSLGTISAVENAGLKSAFGWIPTMGVHWVSRPQMMMGRQTDRAKPSQLMFSKINGRDSLVGAAYGYITATNDTVRPVLFDGAPPWHEHPDLAPPGTTLVMLHVWFVPSPEGPFAGTNPNLPFWAAGLSAPDSDRMKHDANFKARVYKASLAIAEVTDTTAIFPTLEDRAEVRAMLAPHRDSIRALLPEFRSKDSARWDRAATRAAAQWDAIAAGYLASARMPAGKARISQVIAMMLGQHGE